MVKSSILTLEDSDALVMACPDGPSLSLHKLTLAEGMVVQRESIPALTIPDPNILQCGVHNVNFQAKGEYRIGLITSNQFISYKC
jgi:hypothetical protein